MENLLRIFSKIIEAMQTPYGWLLAVIAYFAPLGGVFWLIFLIILADFFTGIWASHIKKVPRSSRRFRKSVEKMFCYFGAIYLFWEFEQNVGLEEYICTYKMIAGFIFLVEIISILENMAVITGNHVFLKIIRFVRGRAAADEKQGKILDDIINEKNESK